MTESFGPEYADAYDALYADKDYDAECDLLERIFRRVGRPVRTVLDLGCGTGAHAVRLAQRGYERGRGGPVRWDAAGGAAESRSRIGRCQFVRGDIRSVRLGAHSSTR